MKTLMALFLLSGVCFKSHGIVYKKKMNKAHNPGVTELQSFDLPSKAYEVKQHWFLDNPYDLPWGVCFPKGKHNFKRKHLNWTSTAMEVWNRSYDSFVYDHKAVVLYSHLDDYPDSHHRFFDVEDYVVRGWSDPDKKLLVWSCDKEKYNLVYPVFGPTEDNVLAYQRGKKKKGGDFYGEIVMSDREEWKKHHFINVMMHELGHLLGILHLDPEKTEIMASHGFGCKAGGHEEICELTYDDFFAFSDLYPSGGDLMRMTYEEKIYGYISFQAIKALQKKLKKRH